MKYAAIADRATEKQYTVTFMCAQLGVVRQGYHRWLAHGPLALIDQATADRSTPDPLVPEIWNGLFGAGWEGFARPPVGGRAERGPLSGRRRSGC